MWQRETRKPLPNGEGTISNFEIQFARIFPEGEVNSSKKYVVYDLTCRQDTHIKADASPATIERRYSDFLKLYEAFKKNSPQLIANVAFPKKRIMGNFSCELIAERALAFENFLDYVISVPSLRDSEPFLGFLQDDELDRACRLLDERRNEVSVPILENIFQLVNKVYLDKSKPVLLLLCRLVAACTTSPIPHPSSEKYVELALRRFDHVSDVEMLVLYIPLLNTCSYLFWQKGRDAQLIHDRLEQMGSKGIKIKDTLSLSQAIHAMDTRSETF